MDTRAHALPAAQPAPVAAHNILGFHILRQTLALLPEEPPLELGRCRAACQLLPHVSDSRRRGVLLSMALRDAITLLRPHAGLPAGDRRWWPYRICLFEYVEGRSRGEVEELLAISASTYSRAKRHALERIAAQLPHLLAEAGDDQPTEHREAAR